MIPNDWRRDAADGHQLSELRGHSNTVLSVRYNRTGNRLATGSKDNTVRLWDAGSGQTLAILEGHGSWVHSVDFSADGRLLASGSADRTVKLWNTETGRLIRTFHGHSSEVMSVQFSPAGHRIASGSEDETVRIWAADSGKLERELTGHELQGAVKSVAWTPDGRRLATLASATTLNRPTAGTSAVRIWDVETGKELLTLESHSTDLFTLAFSNNGRYLAAAGTGSHADLFPAFPWEQEADARGGLVSNEWIERWKRELRRKQRIEIQAEGSLREDPDRRVPTRDFGAIPLVVPNRNPNAKSELLDLTHFYNALLDQGWIPYRGLEELDHDLSSLPVGLRKFGDIDFDVRGIVQLNCIESDWTAYPVRTARLPITRFM